MSKFKEINANQITENTFKLINDDWMLITAQKDDKVNALTASWGGLGIMWHYNVAYIFIRPQRYTREFIDGSKTFSLSFFSDEFKKELMYFGTVSGRDEDKIKLSQLNLDYDNQIPYFSDGKLIVFCEKLYKQTMDKESFLDSKLIADNYAENDFHVMYIGKITKVLLRQED